MIYLGELLETIESLGMDHIMIINKPYQKEHILYLSDDRSFHGSTVVIDSLDMAEVVKIKIDDPFEYKGGYSAATKIYINEEAAFFDMPDEKTYGSGKLDFYDIEHGKASQEQQNIYNHLGFRINK